MIPVGQDAGLVRRIDRSRLCVVDLSAIPISIERLQVRFLTPAEPRSPERQNRMALDWLETPEQEESSIVGVGEAASEGI